MSPAEKGMILRKLEKMEAERVDILKRLSLAEKRVALLEKDSELQNRRIRGLGDENVRLKDQLDIIDRRTRARIYGG